MTKLLQWLLGLSIFVGIWLSLLKTAASFPQYYVIHIWLFPVYCVAVFGVISLGIIVYRVYIFNDCPSAATELKKEIREAKEDLRKRGFRFDG